MENNYFTAAQAREAAEKKSWINFCDRVNQSIIEAYEKGEYESYFEPDDSEMGMLDRMVIWLLELGYDVHQNRFDDLCIRWGYPEPVNEDEHPKTEYLTPLRATDAKKYSDEHSKKELTLKEILDKVKELADVGIYGHTFPLASFCEYNAIRPSTIDRLQELGYDICVKSDRVEVHWDKVDKNIKVEKYLLTAWNAALKADSYNYNVAEEIEKVLDVIHDKSTNKGLFQYTAYLSYPETWTKLRDLGYKVTELSTLCQGCHKI